MNICIVAGDSLTDGFGIERFVDTLVGSPKLNSCKFTVLYPSSHHSKAYTNSTRKNVKLVPIFIPISPKWPGGRTLRLLLFNLFVFLIVLVNRATFDIVHTNGDKGALSLLISRNNSVFTIHGYSLDSFRRTNSNMKVVSKLMLAISAVIASFMEKLSFKIATYAVEISPSSGAIFKARFPQSTCYNIANGVKEPKVVHGAKEIILNRYGFAPKTKLALWIGGDPIRKGLRDALNVVAGLPGIALIVVGCRSCYPVKQKNVITTGRISRNEIEEFYSSADMLIFPSDYEGMPYTVLESISYELPVVGYKRQFMYDIFGENYPLLCDSIAEMKMVVAKLISDDDYYLNLRTLTKEISTSFDESRMAEKYKRIYDTINLERGR